MMNRTPQLATDRTHARAFTLLELLIVIAIIAVLLGLVLIAMSGVKEAGSRTESANALRQIMRGYITYSGDHKGKLLPGYVDPATIGNGANQIDLEAELSNGYKLGPEDTAPFVWRLMPYLDNEWKLLTTDYSAAPLDSRVSSEIGSESGSGAFYAYGPGTVTVNDEIGIALRPAFGLNSIYCGGDSYHGGVATDYSPWNTLGNKTIAATRMSEVLNTGRLIVFAPTVVHDRTWPVEIDTYDVEFGYPELRPPYLYDPDSDMFHTKQWDVEAKGEIEPHGSGEFGNGGGLPIARWSDSSIPTVRMDGSTAMEDVYTLGPGHADPNPTDEAIREMMKSWWPFATGYR